MCSVVSAQKAIISGRHFDFNAPSGGSMTLLGPPTRLILTLASLMNALCWLAFIAAPQSARAAAKTGDVRGTVFIVDSQTGQSMMPGVQVRLEGNPTSLETVTDQQGNYTFSEVTPGNYRIEVKAPGFIGHAVVTVVPGAAPEIPIPLEIDTLYESVTVTGKDEPAIPTDPSGQTVINRSAVINTPNRYDT